MVVHFEVPAARGKITPFRLMLAINAHLPEDIRVMAAARSDQRFHARFDARGKQYRYFVWNHPAMNPLLAHRAWHVTRRLDVAAMRQAACLFVGRRDFRSLAATRSYEPESTVRNVTRCDLTKSGNLLTCVIEGDGFLYKMCRGIAGTLVQVGQGKIAPAEIPAMLEQKDRRVAGMTAPAHGLVLWRVLYGSRRVTAKGTAGVTAAA